MRNFCYVAAALMSLAVVGCKTTRKTTAVKEVVTPSGMKYKMYKDAKGSKYAKDGDFVGLHLESRFGDSVIVNSRAQTGGQPVSFPASSPRFHGDLSELFQLMTPGDSGVFWVSVDTLKANGQKLQPWMEEGKYIQYNVKMEFIKTPEEVKKEKEEKAAAAGDPSKDEDKLQEYFKKNKLSPTRTKSGIYYLITEATDGPKAIPGKTVKVNYTGKLMDGTEFDSNKGREPLSFRLGRGEVILGWDEGIALLKKGEKAKLFIPSHLAYGENSPSPKIPANSILVFDVELVDF